MHKRTKKKHYNKLILVVAILIAYTAIAIHNYGIKQGLSVTLLTWAFFVFATPIADAGFLLAFPIRLAAGIRMLYTQIATWIIGGLAVALYLVLSPSVFEKTAVLQLFHKVLVTPWPLWLILVLSFLGTFMTIIVDDDVYDVAESKHKFAKLKATRTRLYLSVVIFSVTFLLYLYLLRTTHIDIKIF